MLTPNEFILILRVVMPLCPFWRKSIKKCDRESADRQTDRQTDRYTHIQRQTEFTICPVLCYSYGADNNPYLLPNRRNSHVLSEIEVEEHDGDVRFQIGSRNTAVSRTRIVKYAI